MNKQCLLRLQQMLTVLMQWEKYPAALSISLATYAPVVMATPASPTVTVVTWVTPEGKDKLTWTRERINAANLKASIFRP